MPVAVKVFVSFGQLDGSLRAMKTLLQREGLIEIVANQRP